MRIGRLLYWFKDGETNKKDLHEDFYGLAVLHTTLLNEVYNAKRIIFANIEFFSASSFDIYPKLVKGHYFYGGHLTYNGLIDFELFYSLSEKEKTEFIWKKSFEFLSDSARQMKSKPLLEAAEYAYHKGKQIEFNTDFEATTASLDLFGVTVQASVIILFLKDRLSAKLVLKRESRVVFERTVRETKRGVGLFLEIFTRISSAGDMIIIDGTKGIEGFPIVISISKEDLQL